MIPGDLKNDIIKRLKNIKGQIEGITKMLEKDADPDQILIQLKAVRSGTDKAHYLLLDEVYRKVLALKIADTVNKCPEN